jgi:hypothetical protein
MHRFDGLTALKLALEHVPLTPVIILTGAINEEYGRRGYESGRSGEPGLCLASFLHHFT